MVKLGTPMKRAIVARDVTAQGVRSAAFDLDGRGEDGALDAARSWLDREAPADERAPHPFFAAVAKDYQRVMGKARQARAKK